MMPRLRCSEKREEERGQRKKEDAADAESHNRRELRKAMDEQGGGAR